MTAPHDLPVPCPHCGTPLDVDPQCRISEPIAHTFQYRNEPLARRTYTGRAALCPGCDFCWEF